jgi:poly-gamma-glutamate capsule biosynthesis protein CapA/YwtB (metallophosphatase superfamily)
MDKRRFGIMEAENGNMRFSWRLAKLTATTLLAMGIVFATCMHIRGQEQTPQNPAPRPRRELGPELQLKINAPFTLAAVGDIIAPETWGDPADPGYQNLIRIIRGADVGFANMEMSLVDMTGFRGPLMGTLGPLSVGADIKAMGITIMNRANNHAFDGGVEGMFSTDKALDNLGIVHAGTGHNLNEARAASFLATPKGRIGVVGVVSIDTTLLGDPGSTYVYMAATYKSGDLGGRPGLDPVRLTTYHVVTPEQLRQLRAIRDAVAPGATNAGGLFGVFSTPEQNRAASADPDRLRLFDTYFKSGTKPGSLSYEMNADDERDILRSVRDGKIRSDFVIATIHAHHGHQMINGVSTASDWLIELAHKCIDNGADVFIAHGPHAVEGVEIYKGKPIFYGMSSWVFQTDLQISLSDKATLTAPGDDPLVWAQTNGYGLESQEISQGLLTTSHYEGGRLVEVRLYPTDMGGTRRPMSRMGIPMTPSPEIAQRILQEIQTKSKQFGTTISIDNNVGVIRVVPD